jgi:DNA-binding NtrC family response regulator
MSQETVIVLGNLLTGLTAISSMAARYGWAVEPVSDLKRLAAAAADHPVVAVLLDAPSLGVTWLQAVESVRKIAPRALPIICHRFSEDIEWPELADAGAFHAVPVPFDVNEVRQSLGFVAAASQSRCGAPLSMKQVA